VWDYSILVSIKVGEKIGYAPDVIGRAQQVKIFFLKRPRIVERFQEGQASVVGGLHSNLTQQRRNVKANEDRKTSETKFMLLTDKGQCFAGLGKRTS
jgi:hypothetical protein